MAFKKYSAKLTLTKQKPFKHTMYYTDFPMWRIFNPNVNMYDINIIKFNEYFESPFAEPTDLLDLDVAGDYMTIDKTGGQIDIALNRSDFLDYEINDFQYAKIEISYDENKSETFYCWIISKHLVDNDLTYMNFKFILDIIPSFLTLRTLEYRGFITQHFQAVIDRRSFYVYKDNNISYEIEQKRRIERKKWNISCDELCQGEENLYYNHHFKSSRNILGAYVYNTKLPDGIPEGKSWLSNNAFLRVGIGQQVCDKPPCTLNFSPWFIGNISACNIPTNAGGSPLVNQKVFTSFEDTYNRWKLMGGQIVYDEISFNSPNQPPTNFILIILYESTGDFNLKNFQLKINEFPNEQFKYNDFKSAIPLHFQDNHTKYMIKSNQDEINEIDEELIFLNGFNYQDSSNQGKWIDDILLQVNHRALPDSIFYDVYFNDWTNPNNISKIEFNQRNIKLILSFENWMRIYSQASDLDNYLRANAEQRKIAQQQNVNEYVTSLGKRTLGGIISGALVGAKVGSLGGAGGAAIGGALGLLTVVGSKFFDQATGTDFDSQDRARLRDLRSGFTPPIPSSVGANYTSIYTPLVGGVNLETQIMHPLGLYVTEVTSFGWEWKYNFTNYQTLGQNSQDLLNNIINFGEKCYRQVQQFNLFDFIVNNKTDQDKFYIHFAGATASNQVYYSNIFEVVEQMFIELLVTGIRFIFQDNLFGLPTKSQLKGKLIYDYDKIESKIK